MREYSVIDLPSFSVIGYEGSTKDGEGFVGRLYQKLNNSKKDISACSKPNMPKGTWGLMSDFERKLLPWTNYFRDGLYLAGLEVDEKAIAPKGMIKWDVPAREYVVVYIDKMENYSSIFNEFAWFRLAFEDYRLVGAACDFCDEEGKMYIYFPVKKEPLVARKGNETHMISPCGLHCGYCFFKDCGGCLTNKNYCSYAMTQEDNICPNVKCVKEKGLDGCYECDMLENCKIGFFADEGQSAHASSMFIKKYGKNESERLMKSILSSGRSLTRELCAKAPGERYAFLESEYEKLIKSSK